MDGQEGSSVDEMDGNQDLFPKCQCIFFPLSGFSDMLLSYLFKVELGIGKMLYPCCMAQMDRTTCCPMIT